MRIRCLVLALMFGSASWPTSVRAGETIQFSVNIVINDQEVSSIGRADYTAPSLCLDCRHWGNHRINGASKSVSWNLAATAMYEQQISDWIRDGGCYSGFIEGWGSGGFYGNKETTQKCALCALWTEVVGGGTIAGAPAGKSEYNCGASISLSASPADGWKFVQWSGSISTTSPTVSFSLDASKTMTAFFEQLPPPPPRQGTDLPDCPESPIVIDLDGNGFDLVGLSDAISFDIDGDGDADTITWTAAASGDAFLALDRNGNGRIDDGTELFGTATRLSSGSAASNGYVALAEFDDPERHGDGDGVIGSADAIWSSLVLWIDRNHNGVSETNEISSVSESGLVAFDLNYVQSEHRDRHGNRFRYMARATMLNPSGHERVSTTYDVFFRMTAGTP